MPKIFTIKMLNGDLFEVESDTLQDIETKERWMYHKNWEINQLKSNIEKMYYHLPEFQMICQYLSKDEEKDDLYYLLLRTDFDIIIEINPVRENGYILKWMRDNKIFFVEYFDWPFYQNDNENLINILTDKFQNYNDNYYNKKDVLFSSSMKEKIEEKWEEFISKNRI